MFIKIQENMYSLKKYLEFTVLLIIHFANHVLSYSLPFLILYARRDLGLDYIKTGMLSTVMIIIMTVVSIPVGFYSDFSRRIKYVFIFIGLIIMSIAWLLISTTSSYGQLLIYFGVLGFGASGYHPPASAIITDLFEEDKGKFLSYNMITGMIGSAISPLIYGGLVNIFGTWQKASLMIGILGFIVFSLGFILSFYVGIFTDDIYQNKPDRVFSKKKRGSMKFLITPIILFSITFISIRSAIFRISSLFTGLLYNDYLNLNEDESTVAASIVLGFATLFIVVGGFISDRYKPRIAMIISSIGVVVGASALVFFIDFSNVYTFTLFYFLLNAAYYLGAPAMSSLLADRVKKDERGKLFGSLFSFGQVISMGVPLLFGYIKEEKGINTAFLFILLLASLAFIIGVYIFKLDRDYDLTLER